MANKQPASAGTTSHDPAFRGSKKNVGKGVQVRPATYTNRGAKGSGVNQQAAYRR